MPGMSHIFESLKIPYIWCDHFEVMLSLHSDSVATYSSVGASVSALLAPTGWHASESYPCRAFGSTETYLQIFRCPGPSRIWG